MKGDYCRASGPRRAAALFCPGEAVQNGAIGALVTVAVFGEVDQRKAERLEFADPLLDLADMGKGQGLDVGTGPILLINPC